jgi:hypothetical protein
MVTIRRFRLGPNSFSILDLVDWPVSWGVLGVLIGLGLGVSTISGLLLSLGFVGYAAYIILRDLREHEGSIFSTGPTLMISWILGFFIRGLIF